MKSPMSCIVSLLLFLLGDLLYLGHKGVVYGFIEIIEQRETLVADNWRPVRLELISTDQDQFDGIGIPCRNDVTHALGEQNSQDKTPNSEQAFPAIDILREQIVETQNKGKLGFRKVILCSSVEGFGLYSPIEPGEFPAKSYLYFEPSNFSTLVSNDRYIIELSVDIFLIDSNGKPIAGKENVFRLNRVSRSPILDLYCRLEINLKKTPIQATLLKIVIHDKIKNSSASVAYKVNAQPSRGPLLEPFPLKPLGTQTRAFRVSE